MTKQLIALALAAAFGIAHAADTKPATDSKPAAVKVAADASKSGADAAVGNTPQTTEPVGTNAPKKTHKHAHKKAHKKAGGAMSDQTKSEPAAPAQPAAGATTK